MHKQTIARIKKNIEEAIAGCKAEQSRFVTNTMANSIEHLEIALDWIITHERDKEPSYATQS